MTMNLPRLVYFSVRTSDESSLEEVARRVSRIIGIELAPYAGKRFSGPAMSATVLGIEIALARVESLQADAPTRCQLQGRQPFEDRSEFAHEAHMIDDYVLHVLNRQEPGRWYCPSEDETRIDAGLDDGRIQDLPEWKDRS
jgi:hypothetical protein